MWRMMGHDLLAQRLRPRLVTTAWARSGLGGAQNTCRIVNEASKGIHQSGDYPWVGSYG